MCTQRLPELKHVIALTKPTLLVINADYLRLQIALRLYTTPVFPFLNDPLRAIKDAPKPQKGEKRKKHPLAVMVMLLIRDIKKLRKVDAFCRRINHFRG